MNENSHWKWIFSSGMLMDNAWRPGRAKGRKYGLACAGPFCFLCINRRFGIVICDKKAPPSDTLPAGPLCTDWRPNPVGGGSYALA